jgi:CheY-like chemotaxis protein
MKMHKFVITVIEDDPDDLMILKHYLKKIPIFDFSVISYSTISEYEEHYEGEESNLILLDLGLPDSNGLDTIRELVEHNFKHTPVVVCSNYQGCGMNKVAQKLGAMEYIHKMQLNPVSMLKIISHAV